MNFGKTARYRKLLNTADTHGWGNNIFQTTLLSGSCVWSVCGLIQFKSDLDKTVLAEIATRYCLLLEVGTCETLP